MLLAIDAGNTNTVFALFAGDKLLAAWRASTNAQRTSDEYAVFLRGLMQAAGLDPRLITAAIMGSVVPDANFNLVKLCRDHYGITPLIVGSSQVKLGIEVKLDRPEEVGADRLINAVAGRAEHKTPLLIVDFGTATTFDVVDGEGNYRGGAIAPGINLSLQALHMAAAKLPRVAVAKPPKVIGTNTVQAIQSGIFWGYVGLIDGMITRIKTEFSQPMTVIATGGLANLFREAIPAIAHTDPDLTLKGLRLIHHMNAA
jgi:type III pantothenate kinase